MTTKARFYSQIEHMAADELDPYELALYVHYKRVCGQNGECWEASETTASKTKMSRSKMLQTRKALAEKGYIHIEQSNGGKHQTCTVSIVDRMDENIARYDTTQHQDTEADTSETVPDTQFEKPCIANNVSETMYEKHTKNNLIFKNKQEKQKESKVLESSPNTNDSLVVPEPETKTDPDWTDFRNEFQVRLNDFTKYRASLAYERDRVGRSAFLEKVRYCFQKNKNIGSWKFALIALSELPDKPLDRWHDPEAGTDTLTEHENRWQAQPPAVDTEYIRLLEQENQRNAKLLARIGA